MGERAGHAHPNGNISVEMRDVNVMLEMSRSWNIAGHVDIGSACVD